MAKKQVSDCYYNVHKQLVKRLQFMWNIQNYAKDSRNDKHVQCERMWKRIERNELENIKLLQQAVARDNHK